MLEIKEVLRQWLAGAAKKKVAARVGCDVKTVRRYVKAGEAAGLTPGQDDAAKLTDELVGDVMLEIRATRERERGEAWARCELNRDFISKKLKGRVRLTKIRRLLRRHGVDIPYSTLYRFAVAELDFGRSAGTVRVADGKPGEELQVDVGWVLTLLPDVTGRRRRMRAWIFTPNVSRYRFVYPCLKETTDSAIEACEAAWDFYGGVFGVLIPDNTKAIVNRPDPLDPKINETFLEYSQSRDFVIDPTRVRSPKDKARVERSVRDTREDCFGGEEIATVAQAREHALWWYSEEYGLRRHSTTQRLPREHFESDEQPQLKPAPTEPYDIPVWCDPKVAPDHFAQVVNGLYAIPYYLNLRGKKLRARADQKMVRFYYKRKLIRTHPRVGPGQKSYARSDFPPEKAPYALRDVDFLKKQAHRHGEAVGRYAEALLDDPLPWTRMRRVRGLLGLAKKYGDQRTNETCTIALAAEMVDVRRLERMLKLAIKPTEPQPTAKVIPLARYLRPARQYALPLAPSERDKKGTDQ
jgi:transposase